MEDTTIRLGVNIDHVATLRQARGVGYPDPLQAALLAIQGGADGITLHLREDRRHIQDADVFRFKEMINVPMNLEMAVTQEMLDIALRLRPHFVCLVPEKREELTTEGGLDVAGQVAEIREACACLMAKGVIVSLFVDPEQKQIDAAKAAGAAVIELHTGRYANAGSSAMASQELLRLQKAAEYANKLGLTVNAGHGLHYENVMPIATIPHMNELNIGHSIIARAVFVGLENAVAEMKQLLVEAAARIDAVG